MGRSLTTRRHLLAALIGTVLGFTSAWAEPADDPIPTYRSTVSEVRLTFFTTDQHQRNVEALEPRDFAVVDNEQIVRKFRSFARLDEGKLDVLVMVDSSESVAPRFRQEMGEVFRLLNETEWLGEDRVSLIAFGGNRSRLVCAGDCRTSPAVGQLFAVHASGLTPLFDSLTFAGEFFSQHRDPLARRVIILFSDGEDTFSRNGLNAAIQAVLASDAQIYAIDVSNSRRPSGGAAALQQMAAATGGRCFPIHDGGAAILRAILADLHAAYVVTYELPSHSVGLHEVRILPTHNLDLQFRCRQAYYYGDHLR